MDWITQGFPVLHYLPVLAQIHVHWVNDAIWPSHPLPPPPPFVLHFPQYQGPFQWVGFSFSLGGQSIGASASASVLPMNIQIWFPLGLIGFISLQSKGLSRVFSSTTVRKHQFFDAQPTLWSNSQFVHDYWKNHSFDYMDLCWQSDVYAFLYAL